MKYHGLKLNCIQIGVLVLAILDTSGIHRTETLCFCPCPYRTRPIVIPDTSDRCRIETNNPLLVILRFSSIIYCIPTSQQMNFSTRELLKAPYGKHDNYQVNLISHFHFFSQICLFVSH